MNNILGKRVAAYDMLAEESSFDVILKPKRFRPEEVSIGNTEHMSGPHGEARHEQ
jgi:hypothetical protein